MYLKLGQTKSGLTALLPAAICDVKQRAGSFERAVTRFIHCCLLQLLHFLLLGNFRTELPNLKLRREYFTSR